MSNYKNGKIYAIRSFKTELIYIGSTICPLSRRVGQHRLDFKMNKNKSSKEIIKYTDNYIELIENYPCNNRDELCKREGEIIRKNISKCVNNNIAGRNKKEWDIDNKSHIEDYVNKNRETINKNALKYRLKNYKKIDCECGSSLSIFNKLRHEKTIKHQDYIKSI